MSVSQKCQYALRAVFELAKRSREVPTTVSEIAEAQAIPPRFLEAILGQLRSGGYVASRRGAKGGYMLAAEPSALAAGAIIRFVDGPIDPVKCIGGGGTDCPLYGNCAFIDMWSRAHDAVAEVYDTTSFQDLVDAESQQTSVHDFCI